MPVAPQDIDHVTLRCLSAARMTPYLAVTASETDALRLYRWNVELSGALHQMLGLVEVILRNAIDGQLRVWNAAQPSAFGIIYTDRWIESPARPLWAILNPRKRGSTARHSTYLTALARAEDDRRARIATHPRRSAPVNHDDLVAHVTFGTWVRLLPRRQVNGRIGPGGQLVLWNNALKSAFPNHPNPTVIWNWAASLHALRNRVAHQESLIDIDAVRLNRMAIRLVKAIDNSVGDWFAGVSRVAGVVHRRP